MPLACVRASPKVCFRPALGLLQIGKRLRYLFHLLHVKTALLVVLVDKRTPRLNELVGLQQELPRIAAPYTGPPCVELTHSAWISVSAKLDSTALPNRDAGSRLAYRPDAALAVPGVHVIPVAVNYIGWSGLQDFHPRIVARGFRSAPCGTRAAYAPCVRSTASLSA